MLEPSEIVLQLGRRSEILSYIKGLNFKRLRGGVSVLFRCSRHAGTPGGKRVKWRR